MNPKNNNKISNLNLNFNCKKLIEYKIEDDNLGQFDQF